MSRKATGEQAIFVQPKTDASTRTIQAADVVLDAVTRHVARFGTHRSGLILTSEIGTPVRTSTLQRAWKIAAREIGTAATPHDFGHYYASVQIAGGTSIKKLQALLGHKSAMETWDTYGHLVGDEDDHSRSVIQGALEGLGNVRTVDQPGLIAFPLVRRVGADGLACRPGSVAGTRPTGDHPSTTTVAGRLQRSTRALGRATLERALSDLAPGGVYLATPVARRTGGLLPHRFTLTSPP